MSNKMKGAIDITLSTLEVIRDTFRAKSIDGDTDSDEMLNALIGSILAQAQLIVSVFSKYFVQKQTVETEEEKLARAIKSLLDDKGGNVS